MNLGYPFKCSVPPCLFPLYWRKIFEVPLIVVVKLWHFIFPIINEECFQVGKYKHNAKLGRCCHLSFILVLTDCFLFQLDTIRGVFRTLQNICDEVFRENCQQLSRHLFSRNAPSWMLVKVLNTPPTVSEAYHGGGPIFHVCKLQKEGVRSK